MDIHVHAPPSNFTLQKNICSTCGEPQWMLGSHAMWYSSDWVCLQCGERYNDDGIAERPFERAWRKKSINNAMQTLKKILDYHHTEWLKAEIAAIKGDKCPYCMKAELEWHDKAPTQQQHN